MNFKYNLLFWFLLNFLSIKSSFIQFPLYTFLSDKPNKTTEASYVNYFLKNTIYTYINIGTPSQKIVANIVSNNYSFYIYYNRCEIPSEFLIQKSKSYNETENGYLLTDIYVKTFLIQDNISFFDENKNNSYKMTFLFSSLNNSNSESKIEKQPYTCAHIGLKLSPPNMKSYNYNFIKSLKELKLINDYVYYIDHNKNYLIIGEEPHILNNKEFKEYQLRIINSVDYEYNREYWQINFDSIFFEINGTKINLTKTDSSLNHNLNVILATFEFMEIIEKNFFNEKIKNKKCKKNYLSFNYINYDCESLEIIQTFPSIYLFNRNLMYTFEINYKDIFIKFEDRYICMIWIDLNDRNYWKLGKPFLQKFLFTFNSDKRILGFYNPEIKENDNNFNNKNKYILIIAIIILLIIAIIIGLLLGKMFVKYKKLKKTDELDNLNSEENSNEYMIN